MSATGESVTRLSDFGFNPSWYPNGRELVVSPGSFAYPTDRGSTVPGLTAIVESPAGEPRPKPSAKLAVANC